MKIKKKRRGLGSATYKPTAYTGGAATMTGFGPADPDTIDFTRPATRPTPDFNKGAAMKAGKKRRTPYNKKEFGD